MKISVITPCYNSSATLERTYMSLLAQDNVNFEWILVDDFSSDKGQTKALILKFAETAPFPVKYKLLDENFFGSRCAFEGAKIADGEFACILDHDDQLTPGALTTAVKYLEDNKFIDLFAGVTGRCINEKGVFIGNSFIKEDIAKEGDIRFKQKITCELFQFTRVALLREYFSVIKPGYTNGYVWAKMTEKYNFLYVNDVFRVYDTGLETSYSNNKAETIRYPEAKSEALLSTLESYNDYLSYNPVYSLKLAASGVRHLLNANKPILKSTPKKLNAKLFFYLSIPLGFLKSKNVL